MLRYGSAVRNLRRLCNNSSRIYNSQYRLASTLVLGEYSGNTVSDYTRSCIEAANQISDNAIHVLLSGSDCGEAATQVSGINGVSKVFICDSEEYNHGLAESVSQLIVKCHNQHNFSHIMAGVSAFSRDILPRVAGILDVSQISDVLKISSEDTFERPIYAGNALCTVRCKDSVKIVTIRPTGFPFDKDASNDNTAEIVTVEKADESGPVSTHIADELSSSVGPSLTSAGVVVSGGRGMGNGDNFQILYELADTIGDAAVGASRAAVDAGFVANDLQVGQTGKVVAPNLYIACGISGAIQHVAGMKDSKIIVAINKDEEAPIFSIADYGLVSDLFDAVPKLTEMAKSQSK